MKGTIKVVGTVTVGSLRLELDVSVNNMEEIRSLLNWLESLKWAFSGLT